MSYVDIDRQYQESLNSFVASGVESEKQLVQSAIKNGIWSKEKEDLFENIQWEIDELRVRRNKMQDIVRLQMGGEIKRLEEQLGSLSKERSLITGMSAESYAEQDKVLAFLSNALWKNNSFSERVVGAERYSQQLFDKIEQLNSKKNILEACFSMGFFDLFRLNENNIGAIFGSNPIEITIFQKNLLIYCKILSQKISSGKIPEKILDDPIKIFEYNLSEEREGIDDLKEKMKAGGDLTGEDLLK
jgi:hypothetical protein